LEKLVHKPSFAIGYLYNLLYTEIQGLPVKHKKFRTTHPFSVDPRSPPSSEYNVVRKMTAIARPLPGLYVTVCLSRIDGSHGFLEIYSVPSPPRKLACRELERFE
jgi:hypothetical protein